MHIADRALSRHELVHVFSEKFSPDSIGDSLLASYTLHGPGRYKDKRGLLPDLGWKGGSHCVQQGKGLFLGPECWLKGTSPALHLTRKIIETSQFTLIAKVSAAKEEQFGPARIISLSADPLHRNFTLGQEGDDLIFRLRTPLAGENGMPDLVVYDVFATTDQRMLAISYNGTVLTVFVDAAGNSHEFEFSPGVVAYNYFFPMDTSFLRWYTILWYAIIFIPLGILISLNNAIRRKPALMIIGGVIMPSLIYEGILTGVSGRGFIAENAFISIAVISCPVLLSMIIKYLCNIRPAGKMKTR
jgi:hypothetical protein